MNRLRAAFFLSCVGALALFLGGGAVEAQCPTCTAGMTAPQPTCSHEDLCPSVNKPVFAVDVSSLSNRGRTALAEAMAQWSAGMPFDFKLSTEVNAPPALVITEDSCPVNPANGLMAKAGLSQQSSAVARWREITLTAHLFVYVRRSV